MIQNPELIIEKEFNDLLFTDEDATPIKVPFLYKKYRRDSFNAKLKCMSCNATKNGNKEGNLDCPYCLGAGYQWDQGIATGWFGKPEYSIERTLVASISDRMAESAFFKVYLYTAKDIVFKDTDIIAIPRLDKDNKIQVPLVIESLMSIYDDYSFRSYNTQSEYNRYRMNTTFDASFKRLVEGSL